ncbi:MAG TPA: hypothetical protein DCO82_11345 [Alphaproteobacteria bacterium]|nr:hypothetical protein [Alphaproteobacteria bacterium]
MMQADTRNPGAAPRVNPALRRKALATRDNPRTDRDYIVSLRHVLTPPPETDTQAEIICQIRYVPDRLICDTSQIEGYFKLLAWTAWDRIEECANMIADDFCDEVIPRWLSVNIILTPDGGAFGSQASVHVEDRQPHWDNPSLLQRPQQYSGNSSPPGATRGQIRPLR